MSIPAQRFRSLLSLPRSAGRLGLCLAAAATLALAAGAWEYGLYALVFAGADVTVDPVGLAAHALLDGALLWPLAAAALALGLASARRRPRGWQTVAVAAAVTSLAFCALGVAADAAREEAHEAIGRSTGLAVAQTIVTSSEAEDGAGTTALCSVAALRDKGAARREALTGVAEPVAMAERLERGLASAATGQLAVLPLLLGFLVWRERRRLSLPRVWSARGPRTGRGRLARASRLVPVGLGAMVLVGLVALDAWTPGSTAQAQTGGYNPCTDGGPLRVYDVSAIHVEITLNRFGDHNPDGYMYALTGRVPEIRAQEAAALPGRVSIGLRQDPIQPLVIRAAMGECLRIHFKNELTDGPASFHPMGLPYTAANAAGHVGNNPDTFAPPGQIVTYEIPIPSDAQAERGYYVHDHGASRQRVVHGLFGAIVVEPAGASWRDPETGELRSDEQWNNWEAVILDPNGVSFREFVILYHEVGDEQFAAIEAASPAELPGDFVELPTVDGGSLPQLDEIGIYRPGGRALNYRSEPFRNRLLMGDAQTGVTDESQGYGSYMFGDPATPIPRSYLGEPTKTRLMHGGTEVFHVHHLHGGADRWRRNPDADPNNVFFGGLDKTPDQAFSTHLDSQSIGPGTSYNLEHECGAGGCQQVAGDFLWHCHIGHHYLAGMWSFWRVFDTDQTGDPEHPLAIVPELFDPFPAVQRPPDAVVSYELLGTQVGGKTFVLASQFTDPQTQIALEPWIESQLPPPGVPFADQDATVWNWTVEQTAFGPLYRGEPEDARKWPNFVADFPGQRPPILFNPTNGRYAWPLLRPHLAQRPPFSGNGHTGTPWLGFHESDERPDALCPAGNRLIHYPLSSVNVTIPTTPTQSDPLGKIFVLNENKPLLGGDDDLKEPLALRFNVGDCAELLLTNEIPAALTPFNHSKTNVHTHFIQFDPQASDGVITGLSFEQSVLPYEEENRHLAAAASEGATTIQVDHTNGLRPGVWIGIGLGEGIEPDPLGGPQPVPHTEIRQIASQTATSITFAEPLAFDHGAGEAVGVEFVRYNWYADVDTGTTFFHTHVDFKDWDHGLFGAVIVEPAGSTWHHPVTGDEIRSGTLADIHVPPGGGAGVDLQGSFRELVTFVQNPVAGGEASGAFLNLRAEPLDGRGGIDERTKFSSIVHGDPHTQELRTYVGDPVVFRAMGLVERVGGLRITGHRFRQERFAATSDVSDGTFVGISERFDLALDGGAGGGELNHPDPAQRGYPGDYLFYSTLGRDLAAGAWGILRVHDTAQGDLQPLPDRGFPSGGAGLPNTNAGNLGSASSPGNPCPAGAPLKQLGVKIVRADVVYQDLPEEIVDSGGIVYRRSNQSGGGGSRPEVREPLVLRANAGDCVEITLQNTLGDPAGLSLGELRFVPQGSYGVPIGFNPDSSVAKGKSRTYRYYADEELGTAIFLNLVDLEVVPRGAYGAVIVEPAGTVFLDPATGQTLPSGVQARIVDPSSGFSFQELVALFSDEDEEIGQNQMPYRLDVDGVNGISYGLASLFDRNKAGDPDGVFDGHLWGDPRWVVEAAQGEPVTFRVAKPWGEQVQAPAFEGHRWLQDPAFLGAETLFADVLAPGQSKSYVLAGGAGQGVGDGDFLFVDRRQPFMEAGHWALLRVAAGGALGSVVGSALDETQRNVVKIDAAALTRQGDLEVTGSAGASTEVSDAFVPPHDVHLFAGTLSGGGRCGGELIGRASIAADGSWTVKVKAPAVPPRFVCAQFPDGSVAVRPLG